MGIRTGDGTTPETDTCGDCGSEIGPDARPRSEIYESHCVICGTRRKLERKVNEE